MTTWHRGSEIVHANRARQECPLREFVAELHAMDPPLPRVSGTAVFLNPSSETTPLALRANVEHNHVLHERIVIVTVQSATVPRLQPADRVTIDEPRLRRRQHRACHGALRLPGGAEDPAGPPVGQ